MIRAISADRRLLMIRYMKATTMAKPRKVNIEILQAVRDVKRTRRRQSAQYERRVEWGSERGAQKSKSEHQNHRIVVVDGPENLKECSSWLTGLSPAVGRC
jgi:hypothetical protein